MGLELASDSTESPTNPTRMELSGLSATSAASHTRASCGSRVIPRVIARPLRPFVLAPLTGAGRSPTQ